ncbi:odorant binding protein 12 [Augochlora pura]
MKYLTVLLCLFLCYELSTQHRLRGVGRGRRLRDAVFDECTKSTGVTIEDMEALDSGEEREKFLNGDGDYRNVGCFTACLLQHYGFMEGATFKEPPSGEDYPMDDNEKQFIQDMATCRENAEGAGDECDVALAYEVCMGKLKPHQKS